MQPRTRTITAVTAVALGCAVAAGVPLAFGGSSDPAAVSTIGSGAPTRLASAPPALPATAPSGSSAPPAPPSAPVRRAAAAAPVRLAIPGVGITAPVVPVGVEADGAAEIPERVDTVGWYRFGPAPGARTGSIVLMGHVDDAQQGPGAFFRLREVAAGATVTVTTRDGTVHRYRVVGREEYPKNTVPLDALFSRSGAARLTLITCGGSFDGSVRSYTDNVVVTAVPVA